MEIKCLFYWNLLKCTFIDFYHIWHLFDSDPATEKNIPFDQTNGLSKYISDNSVSLQL